VTCLSEKYALQYSIIPYNVYCNFSIKYIHVFYLRSLAILLDCFKTEFHNS